MRGRTFILGLLGFTAVFAVALWWFQTRAWYETEDGLAEIAVAGMRVPVSDYRGITGPSPLKLRGCFRVDPARIIAPLAEDATPLVAPGWFDCFDAGALTGDIAAGRAVAYLAAANDPKDYETILALYPDGRGYLWRQLNARFRE